MALKSIKISASLFFILICNSALSGGMGAGGLEINRNGPYVGASIGISDLQDKTSHMIAPEVHYLGGAGILGGGFVGYDFNLAPGFHVGVEGFANANGLNTAIQHYNQTTGVQDHSQKLTSRYALGFRLVPGFQFTSENEGHLILGYSNAQFNNNDNGTYGYLNANFHANGFQGGAGWSVGLTDRVLVRLDVLYTLYSPQSSTGFGLVGSGSPFQYYEDRFNTLEADLSLIYKFA